MIDRGPALFLDFINELCKKFTSVDPIFVDDLKIYRVTRSELDPSAIGAAVIK